MSAAGRAQRAVLRLLARLPDRWQVALSGEPPHVVDGQTLDPMLQLVRALQHLRRAPGLVEPDHLTGRTRFRREMRALAGPRTPVGAVRDLRLDGGGTPVPARHYAPKAGDGRPLLVYLHGGGFVIGDLETHDETCRLLCAYAETHVLSVDYRLAPEQPFPAALDDTMAALRWAQAHAATLGADEGRVCIGGDSAGGNLAAVAARLATREGTPPAAQLLIYPAVDSETPRPSHGLFGHGYFLGATDRAAFARYYVQGTGVAGTDPRVSPLHAPDLDGLPPALVVTAGFDSLRDEGEAYAEALRVAGTPTTLRRFGSLGHGFVQMTGFVPAARRAMIELARDWRRVVTDAGPARAGAHPGERAGSAR